jgi:hypothetical protein
VQEGHKAPYEAGAAVRERVEATIELVARAALGVSYAQHVASLAEGAAGRRHLDEEFHCGGNRWRQRWHGRGGRTVCGKAFGGVYAAAQCCGGSGGLHGQAVQAVPRRLLQAAGRRRRRRRLRARRSSGRNDVCHVYVSNVCVQSFLCV